MTLKQTRVLHHVVSFLQLLFTFHIFIATRFEYCPYAALQKLLMNVNFELIKTKLMGGRLDLMSQIK